MIKAKKNRKLVAQNQRNHFLNRFYLKKIKFLIKVFRLQSKLIQKIEELEEKEKEKNKIFIILKQINSILDKSVKKGVIHKNSANRKKSIFGKLFNRLSF
jgi:ribosomal protein S20